MGVSHRHLFYINNFILNGTVLRSGEIALTQAGEMVPPERVELSSPAPEAGTLSTELKGHVLE